MTRKKPFNSNTPLEISKILAERLKQHRLYQDLSQIQLAELSGLAVNTVARIETGQGGKLENVIRMAVALKQTKDFLVLFDTPPKTRQPIKKRASIKKRNPTKKRT